MLDGSKDLREVGLQQSKVDLRDAPLRMQNDVDRRVEGVDVLSHSFPDAPLDAIALHGIAHGPTDSESDSRTGERLDTVAAQVCSFWIAQQEEVAHLLAKPLAAGLIDPLIISVPAKFVGGDHGTGFLAGRESPGREELVAVTRADGDLVTALGSAAAEHSGTRFGLHTRQKTMSFSAVAAVGLKGTLRHVGLLLLSFFACRNSFSVYLMSGLIPKPILGELNAVSIDGTLAKSPETTVENAGVTSPAGVLHKEWCNQIFVVQSLEIASRIRATIKPA